MNRDKNPAKNAIKAGGPSMNLKMCDSAGNVAGGGMTYSQPLSRKLLRDLTAGKTVSASIGESK